jgi:hypothetical protein
LAGLPGSVEQDGGALGVAFNAGVQAAHSRGCGEVPVNGGEREVDRGARLVRAMLDDINARRDMLANRGRPRSRFEEPDMSVYTYSQAAQRLSRLRGEFLALQQKGEHLLTDDDMRHADELRGEITALRRFEGD